MTLINVKEVPSLISKGVGIKGDISDGRNIEIEGNVDGNITADVITLREGGNIKGDVKCKIFNIKGHFNGNANCEKINISDTATITGVLEYSFLSVDYGASVNCELKRILEQQKNSSKILDVLKSDAKNNSKKEENNKNIIK